MDEIHEIEINRLAWQIKLFRNLLYRETWIPRRIQLQGRITYYRDVLRRFGVRHVDWSEAAKKSTTGEKRK